MHYIYIYIYICVCVIYICMYVLDKIYVCAPIVIDVIACHIIG